MSRQFNECMCCKHVIEKEYKDKKWSHWNFDTNAWEDCVIVKKLPYDIAVFETDTERFVAPLDSYRLVLADSKDSIDTKKFDAERKWRESVCSVDAIVDVECNGKWVKGVVRGLKCDVTEWVLRIMYRKSIFLIGFIHMDSKRIAPENTYTVKLSQQDLDDELKAEKVAIDEYNRQKKIIHDRIVQIPLHDICQVDITPVSGDIALVPNKSQKNTRYRDFAQWIKTLKIHPDDASLIDFKKQYNTEVPGLTTPGLLLLVAESKNGYNVAWESRKIEHKDHTTLPAVGDIYTDIHIDGPKDAVYVLKHSDVEIGRINGGESFEFDINNPLIQTTQSYTITSSSPGTIIYRCYYVDIHEREVLYVKSNNPSHIILHAKRLKKYAFLGMAFSKTLEFTEEQLKPSLMNSKEHKE